jgi:pimeloyl-ACP methyl ester carboxylesterase
VELEQARIDAYAERGVDVVGRRVRDREGREQYVLERPGDKAVVLVHGGAADASVWLQLVPLLPASWRLLIVDRPGHGLSYPVDYRGSDYRRLAAESLEDLLDGLDLDDAHFIANSMGGFFALAFALAHPVRVRSAFLPGAPAGLDKELPVMMRVMALPIIGPMLNRLFATDDPEVVRAKVFAPLLVKDGARVPLDVLEMGILAANQPHQLAAWISLQRRFIKPWGTAADVFIREEVASLQTRTLFAWGDADVFAPTSSGEALAARMPDAVLEVVADAGHLPWIDQPARCAELAAHFIDADADIIGAAV